MPAVTVTIAAADQTLSVVTEQHDAADRRRAAPRRRGPAGRRARSRRARRPAPGRRCTAGARRRRRPPTPTPRRAASRDAPSTTAAMTAATKNCPHSAMNGSALRLAMRFQPACKPADASARTVASEHAAQRHGAPAGRHRRPATAAVRSEHQVGERAVGVLGAPRQHRLGQRQHDVAGSSTSVRHVGSAARSKHSQVPSPNWT